MTDNRSWNKLYNKKWWETLTRVTLPYKVIITYSNIKFHSSVRSSLQIISQSEPEIPKLNSCCAVSCQFHYTSMLHENHLSKTCFTRAKGVLSLHFVPCFVLLFFPPFIKAKFLLRCFEQEMPNEYVNLLFMPSLHYAPQESCASFFFFFFLRVCLSAVKTQLFLFRFLLVAKRPFQMIPSVLMHCFKLTLKRRRILEPLSFLLNCCSGHRKTRKTAVFSCSVACWVIGNCWIRDEMRDTLGKKTC